VQLAWCGGGQRLEWYTGKHRPCLAKSHGVSQANVDARTRVVFAAQNMYMAVLHTASGGQPSSVNGRNYGTLLLLRIMHSIR
jgi:hypothetical protein